MSATVITARRWRLYDTQQNRGVVCTARQTAFGIAAEGGDFLTSYVSLVRPKGSMRLFELSLYLYDGKLSAGR